MNRRGFLGIALAAALGPMMAHSQEKRTRYRIGYLFLGTRPAEPQETPPWPTLRNMGYVEGTNLEVERRFAAFQRERLAAFAAELAALQPDLILARGGQAAEAVSRVTSEIPTVVMGAGDPVGTGLVKSLARPGGNITGVTEVATELSAKRLQLLREAIPAAKRVAVMWNSADRGMTLRYQEIENAARILQVEVQPVQVREPEDFDDAFAAMHRDRPDALLMITDALLGLNRKKVVEFTAQTRLPAVYEGREPVDDGGLMSYGPSLRDLFGRTAYFIDKILKGANPGDLPIEQPTRFELVVNLKTARRLGLSLPPVLLARADVVIE
jgi:putative tryptophan/tyrosine transport system substrate-binding protein